ncbi:MAG TPA: DNA repair protein RecO [Woeseiaceae bacterium]|nr:DNA repair protein RecO [Woeseiaceae bacterium]
MIVNKRISNAPAWLLHHRPFRDSSQLLDIISRDNGRLTLVARGSRGAKSRLRGILRPFMPLQVSWSIRSDLGTLTGAEMDGPPIALNGEALLAGYYLNELLLNLLHRHDPQPEIFAAYAQAVDGLARRSDLSACLREFEIALLRNLGYALILDHDARAHAPLRPDLYYEYRADQGPVPVSRGESPGSYSGDALLAIGRQDFSSREVLQAATRLLRDVIAFHLGGRELKTRQVLLELRDTARIPDNAIESADNRNLL